MELGQLLPFWSIVPFAGMLLSIAIFPLVKGEWWESHELHVALFWAALFLVPFVIAFGPETAAEYLSETIVGDYIPFIVLL
ncbi:MAG: sodium:proton antiporter [Eggerthellaceae bacterium]|nr:sodium:proton antiporter [Eggerthellaceae bacterium]